MAKVHTLVTLQKHFEHKARKEHDGHRAKDQAGPDVGFLLSGCHDLFFHFKLSNDLIRCRIQLRRCLKGMERCW